jgi:hypothetical protein
MSTGNSSATLAAIRCSPWIAEVASIGSRATLTANVTEAKAHAGSRRGARSRTRTCTRSSARTCTRTTARATTGATRARSAAGLARTTTFSATLTAAAAVASAVTAIAAATLTARAAATAATTAATLAAATCATASATALTAAKTTKTTYAKASTATAAAAAATAATSAAAAGITATTATAASTAAAAGTITATASTITATAAAIAVTIAVEIADVLLLLTTTRGVEQLRDAVPQRQTASPPPPLARCADGSWILTIRPIEKARLAATLILALNAQRLLACVVQLLNDPEIIWRQLRHHRRQRDRLIRCANIVGQAGRRAKIRLDLPAFRVLGLLGLREAYRNGLLAALDLGTSLGAGVKSSALELAHHLMHPSLLLGFGFHGSERHALDPGIG